MIIQNHEEIFHIIHMRPTKKSWRMLLKMESKLIFRSYTPPAILYSRSIFRKMRVFHVLPKEEKKGNSLMFQVFVYESFHNVYK